MSQQCYLQYSPPTAKLHQHIPIYIWDNTVPYNIPTLNKMVLSLQLFDDDVSSKDDKCKVKLEHEDITDSPKRSKKTVDIHLLSRNRIITFEISYAEYINK